MQSRADERTSATAAQAAEPSDPGHPSHTGGRQPCALVARRTPAAPHRTV